MQGLIYKNFIYLPIFKNGSTTFIDFLTGHGWERVELLDFNRNLSQYKLWGHITDPNARHTRGIEEFLRVNNRSDAISDPLIQKICASTMLDMHTCSIWISIREIAQYPIHWIPLDAKIVKWNQYPEPNKMLNGNDLTNDFFRENNLDLFITENDNKNVTRTSDGLREAIEHIKQNYKQETHFCNKWYLEPDLILYSKTLDHYRKKYMNETNI